MLQIEDYEDEGNPNRHSAQDTIANMNLDYFLEQIKATIAIAGRLAETDLQLLLRSAGGYDGWILESSESSTAGGSMNSTAETFTLGDDASNRQYRAILSFSTGALPDTAIIRRAIVKIKQSGLPSGSNPFSRLGSLMVDIRKPYFGTTPALQWADFNAAASSMNAAQFSSAPAGGWYGASFKPVGLPYINKTGMTQLRLRFWLDDDNDHVPDFARFFSGNSMTASYRPQLVVTYYLP